MAEERVVKTLLASQHVNIKLSLEAAVMSAGYCFLYYVEFMQISYFLDRLELGHRSMVKLTLQPEASTQGWNSTISSSLRILTKSAGSGKTMLLVRSR